MKKQIALNEIVLDKKLHARAKRIALAHMKDLKYAYEADKESVPCPRVWLITGRIGFYLTQGWTRIQAAKKLGIKRIECEVRNGNFEDAMDDASVGDIGHGLPRSDDDKRVCAEMQFKIHPDWSDRKIADRIFVSPSFVGKIRSQVSTVDTSQQENKPKRKGRDGKTYSAPADTPAGTPDVEAESKPGIKEIHADLVKKVKFLPIRSKADEWLESVVKLATAVAEEVKDQ
jgi:ParB-like chromosome segregation protein Spo0J